ncbi:MAG: hypothetical protein AAF317_05810 [Pseudomonadota bacterium]
MLRNTWALMLGMFLLQLGNGMQGTALGLRGGIEDFSSSTMGYVMTGYFVCFRETRSRLEDVEKVLERAWHVLLWHVVIGFTQHA